MKIREKSWNLMKSVKKVVRVWKSFEICVKSCGQGSENCEIFLLKMNIFIFKVIVLSIKVKYFEIMLQEWDKWIWRGVTFRKNWGKSAKDIWNFIIAAATATMKFVEILWKSEIKVK